MSLAENKLCFLYSLSKMNSHSKYLSSYILRSEWQIAIVTTSRWIGRSQLLLETKIDCIDNRIQVR